ncbi:MAG: SHOCT domain-containing protein, partial [Ilumatobacteraceae bacterium]
MSLIAAEWGSGQMLWSFLWFFMFFIWIWLLIAVFSDIFRSHDLSGWGKGLWTIGIIVLPYIGVLAYLIIRGHKMSEHAAEAAKAQDAAFKSYV